MTSVKDSTGQWANFATAAVVDSQGGLRSNVFTETSAQEKPFFKAYVRTGSTAADTQGKIWVGLTSGSLKAATDTALHVAAFRFVPGTAGGWSLYTNDGSGGGTATASNIPISLTKRYRFGVRVFSSHTATDSVVFYVDGARVGANTTNLPAFATNLGYHVCVSTKATTARNFRIGKIYLLTGAGK